MIGALRSGCQVDFETLSSSRGNHVRTRIGGTPAASGAARASWRLSRRTQPCPMDGAPLLRASQPVLPEPIGIRGISSDDPWHCISSHQGAWGRWLLGPTAIRGGRAKRYSPIDGQGQRSDCARSVRSSGPCRGLARPQRANRAASRSAPRADRGSCEWSTSALRCLPGLRVPRWRSPPPLNARDPVGRRMSTVRRSDRAGGRWSPLRLFFS